MVNAALHSPETWLPLLREALAREGRFRFPLRGTSMRPTLPVACEIEIAPLPARPATGCLLVFANGDALVAHRLIARRPVGWITQGDGRLAADRPLRPEQVLGVATAAYLNGLRIWPGRAENVARWFWVARHYALRSVRFVWRGLQALFGRGNVGV